LTQPQPITFYLVIALIGFLIGLSKGGMGAALVVLSTPILSLVMPVQMAISLALPLLLAADAVALWMYRGTWDNSYIRRMLPAATLGVIVGSALLAVLPDLALRRIMGLFTLSFVVYRLVSDRLTALEYRPRGWHAPVAGGLSGAGSALANVGAPPFTAYMLLQPISPTVFVGTTTLFFAVVNTLKLPGLIVTGIFDINNLWQNLWVLPIILTGVFAGRWLIQRINRAAFDRLMLAVLTLAALVLLLR
jgi:uncharacterized protein